MIIDGISASYADESASLYYRSIALFLKHIETKLGVRIVRDIRDRRENPNLDSALAFGRKLMDERIITNFGRNHQYADMPQFKWWFAKCDTQLETITAGTTFDDDNAALLAALAEAQERYIWLSESDYFVKPTVATEAEISKRGQYLAISRISGFSKDQRNSPSRIITPDSKFLWVQGRSLVDKTPVYIPAKIVSGTWKHLGDKPSNEPTIRAATSIGLATWPSKQGAELAGMLETIEREAYMVMWLNQLTLPRYSTDSLAKRDTKLAHLFAKCDRYLLKPHIIKLVTDAPTHAIMVVLEDLSGMSPRFSVGLNAHRSITRATMKALTEAVRAHKGTRQRLNDGNTFDTNTPLLKVGHRDRLLYWARPENATSLEFMSAGKEISYEEKPWDNDTEETHLNRILDWCKSKNFECVSVAMTSSKKNMTRWHIEMIVIPELQPTYLTEETRAFGSNRWQEVPRLFGFKPLAAPFIDRPHPFS